VLAGHNPYSGSPVFFFIRTRKNCQALHKKHCGPHILSLFGQPTTAEKKCHSRRTKTLSKAQPFDCTLKNALRRKRFSEDRLFYRSFCPNAALLSLNRNECAANQLGFVCPLRHPDATTVAVAVNSLTCALAKS
jgi:hypothetical protein